MGLRIIDRRDKQLIARMQTMRSELVQREAERFGLLKGGDCLKNQRDFLGKIDHIRTLLADGSKAHWMAERLEKQIIDGAKSSIQLQGPIEPSIVLELL